MGARRRLDPLHVVDVFVYVVVLNLAIEFAPMVIAESFTVSLLTAVLLKMVLEAVLAVKGAIVHRVRNAPTSLRRAGAVLLLVLVLPGSKLIVLELTDLVFGNAVSLGGFVSVTVLIVALMLSRAGVRRLLRTDKVDRDHSNL
jgi:hypothetical protein